VASLIEEPARTFTMQKIYFVLHFSIGHFSLYQIFVLKAASSRMLAISMFLTLGTTIIDQLQY
jgi:hypothetical protein